MKAFSLIELMVVIAIVAILAAVAAPAYNQYIRKAKIDSTIPHFSAIGNKVKEYYDKTGEFPTSITQIGFPSSFESAPASVSAYAIPPYIAAISVVGSAYTPGSCANFTVGPAISNLDSSGAFTATNDFPQIGVQQLYVLTGSNIWTSVCYYYDLDSTGAQNTGSSVMDNCYNSGNTAELAAFTAEYNALMASCP